MGRGALPLVLSLSLLGGRGGPAAACRHEGQGCHEPASSPPNHLDCCAGLVCSGAIMNASSRCVTHAPSPPPPTRCVPQGGACTVKGDGGGINPAAFAKEWTSDCCAGLMCRLGAGLGEWNCTPGAPHPAGPVDAVTVRGPAKLPASLPVHQRTVLHGAYKPWVVELQDHSLLLSYRAKPSDQLGIQRSTDVRLLSPTSPRLPPSRVP